MRLFIFMFAAFMLAASGAAAADSMFDGTKPLICASREVVDCTPGETCDKGLPEEMGAPVFLTIDFAKKVITGPKRTSRITLIEKTDAQITLYGFEIGMGWTTVIDRETGRMTATLAGKDQAFIIFGACTAIK
jgi:hypothetical protein